jgi:hypothetical protein
MLMLASTLLVVAAQAAATAPQREVPSVLERIVVVGASVSAGFGLHRDAGGPVSFGQVLDAAIVEPHGAVVNRADHFFFRSPDGVGRLMLDSVTASRPTLVVAIDFLFWFGYGAIPEEERLPRLERGLALLDELDCEVVVADLPDMSPATRGFMLHESQVPAPATLAVLNEHLVDWVVKDERRHLVPFARCVEHIRAGTDIGVGSVHWPGRRASELLQEDGLHPTLPGAALIAALVGDVLSSETKGVERGAFDPDVAAIAERVRSRAEAARAELEKRRER